MAVKIITDSTSYIPKELAKELDITVVIECYFKWRKL